MRGRILKSSMREFTCRLVEGSERVQATAYGSLLKNDDLVVGDYVEIERQNDEHVITKLHERTNEIYRLLVREQKKKVTAANVDYMVILCSVSRPSFKRGFLDRFVVRARQWNITPLVVFNKMDEFKPKKLDLSFEIERMKYSGVRCFEIAAKDPALVPNYGAEGFEILSSLLKEKTALFVGQSGVGKSTTISALTGGEVELRTQEVGKVGKGTHTTTWSEIIECAGLDLIDSPGIRSLSLEDLDPEELIHYFPEIAPFASRCKFSNCNHTEEAAGCAFFHGDEIEKLDARTQELVWSRLEAYQRIHEEIAQIPHWERGNSWSS